MDYCDHLWEYIEVIFKEIVDKFNLQVDTENIFDLDYPDSLLFDDTQ